MGPPFSWKCGIALVVETLEDRRLLSHAWPASSWNDSVLAVPDHADLAPPSLGPMFSAGESANLPGPAWPGSFDQTALSWTIEANRQAPLTDDPGHADPSTISTSTPPCAPQASDNPSAPESGRGSGQGLVSAGNAPNGSTLPNSPAPAPNPERTVSIESSNPVDAGGSNGVVTTSESTPVPPPSAPSHAPAPFARPIGNFAPTSHVESEPSDHSENTDPSTSEGTPFVLSDPLADDPGIAPANAAHGSLSTVTVIGPGSLSATSRLGLDLGSAKGVTRARSAEETPPSPIEEAENPQDRSVGESLGSSLADEEIDRPDPQLADMIMNLIPFDRSSIDNIVDRFLDPLEGLSSSMPGWNGPMGLLTVSLALAVTVLTVDLAVRIQRSREQDGELDGVEGLIGFPGLPGLGRASIR